MKGHVCGMLLLHDRPLHQGVEDIGIQTSRAYLEGGDMDSLPADPGKTFWRR